MGRGGTIVDVKKKTLAQELAARIVSTPMLDSSTRDDAKRVMSNIAFDHEPVGSIPRKWVLSTLQAAARDERIWEALVIARSELGKGR